MKRAWLFYIILFTSGFSALIYEICWNRQIGLLFGHTAQSSGIVITIYFLGMALGYWWAGRTVDKKQTPLRCYAIAEVFAGTWAFLIPTLIQTTHSPNILLWVNHPNLSMRIVFRITLALLILLPTAIALGYSFPAFARFIAMRDKQPSKFIITCYAWNTVGAFLGVLLAGTLCFYYLGITSTHYLAATISIFCGFCGFAISYKMENTKIKLPHLEKTHSISPFIYGLAILSGFSILGLEVLYTHLFSLISHNSTYNFTATLCSFLISLSLGSFIVARIKKKTWHYFMWICLGISFTIPISLQVFAFITKIELFVVSNNFFVYLLLYFLLNFSMVVLPITAASMILPLCWDHLEHLQGTVIGRITFVNTIFAAFGSATVTFIMIPYLGLYPSFIFFAVLYGCASIIILLYFSKNKFPFILMGSSIAILFMCLFLPKVGKYQRENHEQIWYRETFYGPIEVIREKSSNNLKMTQNFHYILGSSLAEVREKRQAHIPLLLHPSPKEIAFLGMGTGMTTKGALDHKEVTRIDVIELIAEVIEAAKFFHKKQNSVFTDTRVNIIINDARHHFLQKKNKYDVIISDLFIPWHSYTGYLYTKEHYQIASKSLEKDGLFCQWLPLYQLGQDEFEMIANSFSSVFPHVSLWRGEENDEYPLMALIGSKHSYKFNLQFMQTRIDKLLEPKLVKVQLEKGTVRLLLSEDKLLKTKRFFSLYAGEWQQQHHARFNTDDYPQVEFFAPITQRKQQFLHNVKLKRYYENTLVKLPRKKY